jgi:hypothetical protein
MNTEFSSEERNRAMAARLCGLLWLTGGTGAAVQVSGAKPCRHPPVSA